MIVKFLKVGYLQANCYILVKGNDAIVIDPGDEYDRIVSSLTGLNLLAILVTHSHFDHVGALSSFKDVLVYKYDNLEEKKYKIGNFVFEVLYTKGHSDDSVSFYFYDDGVMFTGDFVFLNSIGRTDLETGNDFLMFQSIKKLKKYPKDTILYPGHGDSTTLGDEIKNNPFFF